MASKSQKSASKERPAPSTSAKQSSEKETENPLMLPPKFAAALADEVARTLVSRLPNMLPRSRTARTNTKKSKLIEYGIFMDTSAIIDGRIFDVIHLGILNGIIVIPESILMELKHLADSQDMVKRERGRKGLDYLDHLKRSRKMKVTVLSEEGEKGIVSDRPQEVDEKLIKLTKNHKGKIITCDYNLEKKATIENVQAINVNALANALKVIAVPGESLHIKLLHPGKDSTQGVG